MYDVPFIGNIVRGAIVFYSERFSGRPFNNCLVNAIIMVLRWMGYEIPPDYDDHIRTLAGAPDYYKNGKPRGTSIGELKPAVLRLFPASAPTMGAISDASLLDSLKLIGPEHHGRHKAIFAVCLNMPKLPDHYRRLAGLSYTGRHSIAVVAKREATADSPLRVYILDTMGRTAKPKGAPDDWQPYAGEEIDWDVLSPALVRNSDGLIRSVWGFKNTAIAAPTVTP